jgi:manganese transport protein
MDRRFCFLIGFAFLFELSLVKVDWLQAAAGWVTPHISASAMPVVVSVLGAVVMPHNLFLHSEIIQSRQWNLENEEIIARQLKYEFWDTLMSMGIGWAINSAMIILAAATFYQANIHVETMGQAQELLHPLLGEVASFVFALALLFAGFSSTTTAGIASGSIFAGWYRESYNIKDLHSYIGVILTYLCAVIIIFMVSDPFAGLIVSQILLSIQLPITIFAQIYLTSSPAVMGKYANVWKTKATLLVIGSVVALLNIKLLIDFFF